MKQIEKLYDKLFGDKLFGNKKLKEEIISEEASYKNNEYMLNKLTIMCDCGELRYKKVKIYDYNYNINTDNPAEEDKYLKITIFDTDWYLYLNYADNKLYATPNYSKVLDDNNMPQNYIQLTYDDYHTVGDIYGLYCGDESFCGDAVLLEYLNGIVAELIYYNSQIAAIEYDNTIKQLIDCEG